MKILLDTCVWGGVKKALESAGYDVVWTGDWSVDPGDLEILAWAYQEDRILVTLDKDFGELAIVYQYPHHGIIRLVNLSTQKQVEILQKILVKYPDELSSHAIITADSKRVRIRLP
ncbi:DUF5615 family PIN-like protein [candidate division KSB1 bacterium]|nr:DUF5615 family PIN-like protein [candidate division KSB1 bacterium]